MYGLEPAGADRRAPVYVYATGGGAEEGVDQHEYDYVREMARRGYVAAMADMDVGDPPFRCGEFERLARSVFSYSGPADTGTSVLAVLCGRRAANCSSGIALHGFSFGGLLAYQAPKFAPVSAELIVGAGSIVPLYSCCGPSDASCCPAPDIVGGRTLTCNSDDELSRYLPRERRRIYLGVQDLYYGGTDATYGAMAQAKLSSGYDCGDSANCIQADGSGYHCPNVEHQTLARLPTHRSQTDPMGMAAALGWLDSATRTHAAAVAASAQVRNTTA